MTILIRLIAEIFSSDNITITTIISFRVPTVKYGEIDNTIKRMLSLVKQICKNLLFQNSVDELSKLTSIIIGKYGGRLVDVTYYLPGFGEPLKRNVNVIT